MAHEGSNMKAGSKGDIEAADIWRTGAYAGEFGDPFIADTDLEGAAPVSSAAAARVAAAANTAQQ